MVQTHSEMIANSQLRLTILAIQEVIGEKNSLDILQNLDLTRDLTSLPPDNMGYELPAENFARLIGAIGSAYRSAGPQILERIGKSTFHQVLREHPDWLSLARKTMNLWRPERRVELILDAIIDSQNTLYPETESWIEIKNGQITYIEQNCMECYQRLSTKPVCYLKQGFIKEGLHWATGLNFNCVETACLAAGDPYCSFSIGKTSANQ
jgi:predicted hydrocarbon binding protein